MIFPTLIYGDTEIASYCRSTAYIDAGLAESCWQRCTSRDNCCCGDSGAGGFVDPVTDEAPWIDPDIACSSEYLGLIIDSISYGRPYRARVKDTLTGGFVQTRNLQARELTVSGWLVGASQCGIDYGLDWLNSALDPRKCSDSCDPPDVRVYTCCDLADEAKGLRILKRVSPIEPVSDRTPDLSDRCCRTRVEFKLAAESAYFFREDVPIVEDVVFDAADCCPNWCCPRCNDDIIAPDCLTEELLISRVSSPGGSGSCYCEPLFAYPACAEVPASGSLTDFLNWEFTAGATDLVNVSFVYYEGVPGAGDPISDPAAYACQPFKQSIAALIPANSTVSFDSSNGQTSVVDAAGESLEVYGLGPSSGIELGCEPGWFCVYADSCNDMAGSSFSLSVSTGSL